MNFIRTPHCNYSFGAPAGMEAEVATLPVLMNEQDRTITSFWVPDGPELAALICGNPLALTIHGNGHPIVSMGVSAQDPEGNYRPPIAPDAPVLTHLILALEDAAQGDPSTRRERFVQCVLAALGHKARS